MRKILVLIAWAVLAAAPGLAQSYYGTLYGVTCTSISGWAYNSALPTQYVDIYDGSTIVQANVAAGGWVNPNFSLAPPAALVDRRLHQVYVKFAGTQINLGSGPLALQCTGSSRGYQYYYQSTFSDPGSWTSNGSVSTASNIFSSASEGSWISNVAVPDGSSNYEVRTILSLKQSGGTYVEYLRATGNAISGQGTAIQVTLADPQFSGGGCTAALTVSDMVNGSYTQDGQWTVPCADSMELRVVAVAPGAGYSFLGVMVGGYEYWCVTGIVSTGQPGIGAIGTPSGNGITLAALGPFDSVAPGSIDPTTIKTYLTPNEVDLTWVGVADNPNDGNGVGLNYYIVFRDWVQIGVSYSADYTDTDVSPGAGHSYQIIAQDWHSNTSPVWANIFVTVPAAGSVDPRRVGVVPTGNYWGAMGEQIDTLSGNLNFSISLLKAMGRGGWSVPIGLSYNSQNWRQEGSTSWIMGADVGYGFGWQLMAGSIRPYWDGWALNHFVFTDATGAQYRLDQQNGNVWSSTQSIYVWYDYSTSILHFKDGSYWYMGCISSGEEQDAGAMYPTLMEDTNGNQITLSYMPGAGPFGSNENPPNSSARITQIFDARSHVNSGYGLPGPLSYTFAYNSDTINHLTGITNNFGTAENYSFTVSGSVGLFSPFTGTSACGSTNANCGYAVFLSSVTRTGVNLTTSFAYDSFGYGDLAQVTFPYGGHIRWDYQNASFSGGRSVREVVTRYLLKDTTAGETTYNLHRDSGDPSRVVQWYLMIQDPSGACKVWATAYNTTSSPAWAMGLTTQMESRTSCGTFPGLPGPHTDWPSWTQDTGQNPYIYQTDTYLDQGTANQRHSMTTTTLDSHGYGNVVSSQVYDYGVGSGSPGLLRTNASTYLHDISSAYDTAYIRNRTVAKTVTPSGGSTITLSTNNYDSYPVWYPYYGLATDAPYMIQHDAAMNTSFTLRGNVTQTTTTTGTTSSNYDIEGNAIQAQDATGSSSGVTVDNYGNVPQTATPNGDGNLSTSFSFSSFLAPTSVSQPSNGTSASIEYDNYGRPQAAYSPDGAVTYYYYCPDACSPGFSLPATRNGQNNSKISRTNTRWSRDQYDGLGRVIRTDRGDTSGNLISQVDTDYDSCGCSPTGKMKRTSQPYAPGATVYWTTYTYDGLGRTIQVNAADGGSNTTYAYYGSTTVVTDPAGNWKAMTTDVDGNLKSVVEPDPAYGSPAAPTSALNVDCVSNPAPSQTLGTCYTYDVLKNLLTVTMPRSTGTQTRTFTYQSGTNWLLTATNPENGTVTYTRDAMGHVTKRVDAMGQTTNYTYDVNYRLTQVTREQYSTPDPCQSETYYYDTSIDSGFPSGASWGKLTAVAFGYGTGGTGSCPGTAADGSQWNGILYEYQYSSTGRTIGKRMVVTRNQVYGGPQQADLDAYWTYDNEGRMLSVQYPVAYDPDTGERTSTSYNYSYDNMGRAISMPNSPYSPYVSGVTYNASDQMTAISYFGTAESRTYNAMNQVATLSSGAVSETYNYVSGQNNGQISSVSEGSGETVGYTYDRLKRLISASSTYGWSQTYGYDGFGNMTYKSGSFSTLVDPATNRLLYIGSYDANGNLYLGSWSYDFENRLVGVDAGGGERYMYDPSNKRIYKQNNSSGGAETYYFYGLDGKVLGEYTAGCASGDGCGTDGLTLNRVTESAYFAGKKVLPSVGRDRLGSVRTSGAANHPYGENYSQTNSDGFATYYQDSSTGLNYADQRYYNAVYGRFNTPDRYRASGGVSDPQSFNRYTYSGSDPMNHVDPTGRYECDPDDPDCDPGCDPEDPTCGGTGGGGGGASPAPPGPPLKTFAQQPCWANENNTYATLSNLAANVETVFLASDPSETVAEKTSLDLTLQTAVGNEWNAMNDEMGGGAVPNPSVWNNLSVSNNPLTKDQFNGGHFVLSNVSLGAIATDLGGVNSTDYQDFIKDFGGGIHGKYQHAVTGQAAQHNDWLHSHIYTTGSRAGTATFHFDDYPAWNPLHTAVDIVSGHIPGTCLDPAWH